MSKGKSPNELAKSIKEGLDPSSTKYQQLLSLNKLDSVIRGTFLGMTAGFEEEVSEIVSQYLCPDENRRLILQTAITRNINFTFSDKFKVLEDILEYYFSTIYKEHKADLAKIKELMTKRNRLAHCSLDTSDEFLAKGLKDRVQLIKYDGNKKKTFEFTAEESKNDLAECYRLQVLLVVIKRAIASTS